MAQWEKELSPFVDTEQPTAANQERPYSAFSETESLTLQEAPQSTDEELFSESESGVIDGEQGELAAPRRSRFRIPEEVEAFAEAAEGYTDQDASRSELLESPQEQYDVPLTLSKEITDALSRKDWTRALELAIQEGWRDENKLTNLLFFERHPELGGRKLDPAKNKDDQRLSQEWGRILNREVWPAIVKSAENSALAVSGKDVASQHRQFWGKDGKSFKARVEWAAKVVGLNPGLLAANLLAETGTRWDYLMKSKVSSYRIGVDDFYERRGVLARSVPAYSKVGWDKPQKPEAHLNDAKKPREVKTIRFNSGQDALLASAVYLKYGEIYLGEEAKKLKGDFDKLPVETRFALVRMTFAAGPGGAQKRLVRALKGEDIFVRVNKPLKAYQTNRNATVRTAQALHLSDWIFGVQLAAGVQPELEEFEDGKERYERSHHFHSDLEEYAADDEAEDAELEDEVFFTEAEEEEDQSELFEAFAPKVALTDLRKRIDDYFDRANTEYDLGGGTKVNARPQFRYTKASDPEEAIRMVKGILGEAFEKRHPRAIRYAAYGRAKPSEVAAITQGLIDAGKLAAVRADNPSLPDDQLVRKLQRKFKMGIDCAGYVQLAFIFAFTGSDHDREHQRMSLGLKARRGDEKLADLPKTHFTKVNVVDGQTGDLLVMRPRAGSADRAWHTVIIVDHTVSGSEHTFLVDASWGVDLYGETAGGVARRELVHDTSTGKWWDIHPINGTKEFVNSIGPYAGHPIKGMYRAIQKK